MPDGYGTYTYNNAEYSGEWLNGKQNGKGITRWSNGDVYEGEFLNNKAHGKGILIYGSEDKFGGKSYEGEFNNNLRHGYGIFTWADGTIYKGLWKNDQQTVGIEYYTNGNTFNLSYYNGLTEEAIGDYYYADGSAIKDAYFKNGVLSGEATFVCADTSKCAGYQLKGNWKDGEYVATAQSHVSSTTSSSSSNSSPVADFMKEVIIRTLTGLPAAYLKAKVEREAREKAYKKGYEEGKRKGRK